MHHQSGLLPEPIAKVRIISETEKRKREKIYKTILVQLPVGSQLTPSYLPVNPSEVRDLRGRNWEQGDYWFSVHDEGPEKYPN
jgi:hypothetical protein